jgi:hypothetical protein
MTDQPGDVNDGRADGANFGVHHDRASAGTYYHLAVTGPVIFRRITTGDVVGIALSPDHGGYFMAEANGKVFGFGDATPWP